MTKEKWNEIRNTEEEIYRIDRILKMAEDDPYRLIDEVRRLITINPNDSDCSKDLKKDFDDFVSAIKARLEKIKIDFETKFAAL